jgi:hypothetical protein
MIYERLKVSGIQMHWLHGASRRHFGALFYERSNTEGRGSDNTARSLLEWMSQISSKGDRAESCKTPSEYQASPALAF